ncbi:MAG: type II toxin-antitoxin system HicB family antitoxin [Firmicutes bacterium]|nr:type II toxin-antitoxin system HicB family antitoxin [Bacillota bacterium]
MKVVFPFRVWEEDGAYLIQGLPPFDNVATYGDTLPSALDAAREALTGVLGVMLDRGEPIPDPPPAGPATYMVEPSPKVAIPILLRKAREAAGLTQGDLATRLGTTYQAVQKLERSGANPTVATVDRVIKALGWRLDVNVV